MYFYVYSAVTFYFQKHVRERGEKIKRLYTLASGLFQEHKVCWHSPKQQCKFSAVKNISTPLSISLPVRVFCHALLRWIKFEEKVEKGGERWSKPHVATLSLHSLMELKTCIEKGTIMLDLEASTLPQVVGKWVLLYPEFQHTVKRT